MKKMKHMRQFTAAALSLSLMLTGFAGFTTTSHAANTAAPATQQANTVEMIPGTGITQQYIDDLCTYYGASAAMVGMGNGQNVFLCASWCRQDFVGQLFPGDNATAETVCMALGLQGWAYNEGTPADFYAATGQLQPISTMTAEQLMQALQAMVEQTAAQEASGITRLRNLGLSSDAVAQWLGVKKYAYGKSKDEAWEMNETQKAEIAYLQGLYGIIEAMATRPEGMNDREKVAWASNRIVETVGYNQSTYNDYLTGNYNHNDNAYYLTGALAGSAVCDGYADLFALYMYLDGIPCQEIHGKANNGKVTGGHAWNRVFVDGQWLEVDATWNDAIIYGGLGIDYEAIHTKYLLLTHDEMAVNHFEASAVDLTAEFDTLFAGAGISKGEGWLTTLAAALQSVIAAKQQVIDAYNAASVEAIRKQNKTDAKLIAKEQGLRDGTLVVVSHKLYGSDGMKRCSIGMTNTVTGERENYTHLPEVYGCTKEECMWLKEVMSGN